MKQTCCGLLLASFLLTACGAAITAVRGSDSNEAPAVLATTQSTTRPSSPPALATPIPTTGVQLSSGWHSTFWEGITIPDPPQFSWTTFAPNLQGINGVPVLASGGFVYEPPPTYGPGHVGLPAGPAFWILQFTGSLDDWLKLEQRNSQQRGGDPIQAGAFRDITIAGRPAKAYQGLSVGESGHAEYYIVALDRQRLLWIFSEDSTNETYRRVIAELQIRTK
jgi:hypothetical protein